MGRRAGGPGARLTSLWSHDAHPCFISAAEEKNEEEEAEESPAEKEEDKEAAAEEVS